MPLIRSGMCSAPFQSDTVKPRRWKASVLTVVLSLGLLQPAHYSSAQQFVVLPQAYPQRDYPADTLRRLINRKAVPDSMKVYYLTKLAVQLGQTDLTKAAKYAKQAVTLARRIGYTRGELTSLQVLGNTHTEMGDYVTAMRSYQEALTIAQAHNLKRQMVPLYLCMGSTSATIGDNDRSLKYLLLGHSVLTEICPVITPECADDYGMSYVTIGNTYYQKKDFMQAREYAARALQIYTRSSTSPAAAKANLLMGRVYQAYQPHTQGRLDSAGFFLQAALYIEATKENEKEVAGNLISLAELYQQQRKYRDMYLVAQRSLKMARKVGSKPFEQDAATLVATAAAAMGNYQEAYRYQVESAALNRIMVDLEKTRALEQLQVRYDVQAQTQRIEMLTQRTRADAAAAREQKRWLWMLVAFTGTLIIGLMVGTVLFVRLRKSRRELAAANEEISLANEEISQSVAEKEVLVQEIHHRVKNNLQIISSLLAWQKDTLPDPQLVQVLAGNQARIQSMAMVHEFLYQADNLASVRLDTYLGALLESLHTSLANGDKDIKLRTCLGPLLMDAKDAGYFGLLVNEVVTNAYKHAFTDQQKGVLTVELVTEGAGFFLGISDDGKGLPETGFVSRPNSIGIQLVKTLTKQLKAKITVKPQLVGTRVEITRQY